MKVLELEKTSLSGLREMAKELDVANARRLKKEDLILKIQQVEAERVLEALDSAFAIDADQLLSEQEKSTILISRQALVDVMDALG